MLRHVVLLRFSDDAPGGADAVADAVVAALRTLPEHIPALRDYRVERDLGLAPDNAHVVVTADFDDADGHAEYRDHPAHTAIIADLIRPALTSRCAVQFEL